jgi:hypothetical protein
MASLSLQVESERKKHQSELRVHLAVPRIETEWVGGLGQALTEDELLGQSALAASDIESADHSALSSAAVVPALELAK